MTPPPMPIFARTFDFLSWLLPATNNFPRAHRHTVTQRLLNAAFDPVSYTHLTLPTSELVESSVVAG